MAAICQMWLAARARGIGLGWMPILDPAGVALALDVPTEWALVGYSCWDIGRRPPLRLSAREGWERPMSTGDLIVRR